MIVILGAGPEIRLRVSREIRRVLAESGIAVTEEQCGAARYCLEVQIATSADRGGRLEGDALRLHFGRGRRGGGARSEDEDQAHGGVGGPGVAGAFLGLGGALPGGHGGVACEGCHGSTHAIWPNALPSANDNLAAVQLQGHTGTITECSSCHTSLPLTLSGPHGMHNVNSQAWNLEHEDFYERNPNACRACHGQNLEGSVLSRTAADRVYLRDDEDDDDDDEGGGAQTINLAKGTEVSCTLCHERP